MDKKANQVSVETLQSVFEDMLKSYIQESVQHFTTQQGIRNRENARYFYNNSELLRFFSLFEKAGGEKKTLHCGIVKDDFDEFLCFEVCHLSIYKANKEAFYS